MDATSFRRKLLGFIQAALGNGHGRPSGSLEMLRLQWDDSLLSFKPETAIIYLKLLRLR